MPMSFHVCRPAIVAAVIAMASVPGVAGAATLCSVSGAQLVFGSFAMIAGLDPASDIDRNATADLVITCSGDSGATVGIEVQLDGGTAGNPLARRLSGPGSLAYNIYTDPTHSAVWGDGTSGSSRSATITLPQSNASGATTLTAYGRIPRGQRTAPIGTYDDTVLVTIVY
jgi:spore coat protein U-like protein